MMTAVPSALDQSRIVIPTTARILTAIVIPETATVDVEVAVLTVVAVEAVIVVVEVVVGMTEAVEEATVVDAVAIEVVDGTKWKFCSMLEPVMLTLLRYAQSCASTSRSTVMET